jgi:hypothetical protein
MKDIIMKSYKNVLLSTVLVVLGLAATAPLCGMQSPDTDKNRVIFDGGEFGDGPVVTQSGNQSQKTLALVPVSQKGEGQPREDEYSFANDPRPDFLGCGEF